MGLDMYLEGHKYLWQDWDHPERDRKEDGYRITDVTVQLGYWRKHPNLHGYIVQHFAAGRDECQQIALETDDLRQIIRAVQDGGLPETAGFFFGKSELTQEERDHDVAILEKALAWLDQVKVPSMEADSVVTVAGMELHEYRADREWPKESRSVIYQASW